MRWMNLEPVIQSEVSQKEIGNYHSLMHIYRIYKNGTEEATFNATMQKQTYRIDLWTWTWTYRLMDIPFPGIEGHMERVTWKLTLTYVK